MSKSAQPPAGGRKKVLLVDVEFGRKCPPWASFIRALPHLHEAGFEFTVWCWKCEPGLGVTPVVLPKLPVPGFLKYWGFCLVAHFWWIKERLRNRLSGFVTTVSDGFLCTFCAICYVHFSHLDFSRKQLRMPVYFFRDAVEIVFEWTFCLLSDLLLLWSPVRNTLLVVSRDLARDMRRQCAPWKTVAVLPNSYDPERFNDQVRRELRAPAREHLSLSDSTIVLGFGSQGHYRRKGFWLAVEAIARLRDQHDVRLLVIGGHPRTLDRLRRRLDREYPGWNAFLTFTGMVEDTVPLLSACDALLFPSYSEAFSLGEIEASSLGLRLYLTPHYGHEMLLDEPGNGRVIPWDGAGIARILSSDMAAGNLRAGDSHPGEAVTDSQFAQMISSHLLQKDKVP